MISDVEGLPVVGSSRLFILIIEAWGNEDGKVSLPEANMDMEGRCKSRHLHVVSPFAGLAHLLDMKFELSL